MRVLSCNLTFLQILLNLLLLCSFTDKSTSMYYEYMRNKFGQMRHVVILVTLSATEIASLITIYFVCLRLVTPMWDVAGLELLRLYGVKP
jgi:hypothetical protein